MSPILVAAALAALAGCVSDLMAQGYGGPSVLSRGGNRPGRRGRAPVEFSVYAGVHGGYESRLIAPRLASQTEFETVDSYTTQVHGGLYGGHAWRRSSFGVDYRADYRYTSRSRRMGGTNQVIAASYQNRLSRRVNIAVEQTGGVTNRAFGGFAAPAFSNPDRLGIPLDELFDVRTYFTQTGGSASYTMSARDSVQGGVSAFFIKRDNPALINGQGYRVQGLLSHRLSGRTSTGVQYQFMRFEFPRAYAGSNVHSLGAALQHQLTKNWSTSVSAGASYIASTGTQQVPLSPEVALILGRQTGLEAFSRRNVIPYVDGTVRYEMERGSLYAAVFTGVMPGNGFYLTTNRTTASTGYSYSGIRKASFGASAGYSLVRSLGLRLGSYTSYRTGAGFSYNIVRHLSFTSSADYRWFHATTTPGRTGYVVTAGLTVSAVPVPVSIW